MKKIIATNALLLGAILLAGCGQQPAVQTQPATPPPAGKAQPASPAQTTAEKRNAAYKQNLEKQYPAIKNYWQYIPLAFKDGLSWDDVTQSDKITDFRTIETAKGAEQVSVIEGFRIMYKYPNTEYFAKMHVEQSKKEEFNNDKIKVVDEMKFVSGGKSIEQKNMGGYEYYYLGNDNPDASTAGMALVFFPEDRIISTIYFLNQKPADRKFQTIGEFNVSKDNFIRGLIENKIQYSPK